MKRLALLLAFVAVPASAQQDCVTGAHKYENGQCGVYVLNMCRRPLNCTVFVEGVTAQGATISDSRPVSLQHQGSTTISLGGVARCGSFDVQCSNAAAPRRR